MVYKKLCLRMQRLLELTPEQKQRMVELRHFFLAKLRSILDRRKAIHADITVRAAAAIAETCPRVVFVCMQALQLRVFVFVRMC